jgi:hypothetical protein
MAYEMKPLSCSPSQLKGFSEKLIVSHCENNYGEFYRTVLVSDMDTARAGRFAEEQGKALGIAIEVAKDLPAALAVAIFA